MNDVLLASIPSPSQGVWHLGPIPLRAYAFCIMLGVVVAVWVTTRRWVARGGASTEVFDLAMWAVPFGIVGARLYHVITDYQLFFGAGRDWTDMFRIWQGGLGIWGAVALGALGAWIGARRMGIRLTAFADAAAPGILLAQAIGRWGNYFNQELFGRPTTLPWGLEIDVVHRPAAYLATPTFHPTFLYECLWCIGVAVLVVWADRRFTLGHGRAFFLYVIGYTIGRAWIEHLRDRPGPPDRAVPAERLRLGRGLPAVRGDLPGLAAPIPRAGALGVPARAGAGPGSAGRSGRARPKARATAESEPAAAGAGRPGANRARPALTQRLPRVRLPVELAV